MTREKDFNKTELIYKHSLKLVLKKGFSGLRMQDVADEAKLAAGTLYIYFKNKEELLNNLFLYLFKDITSQVQQALNPQIPLPASLQNAYSRYFRICLSQPEKIAFIEQFVRSSYYSEPTSKLVNLYLEPVYLILNKAIEELLIKELPVEIILAQLTGPVHDLIRFHNPLTNQETSSLADTMFKLAWDSIRR